MCTICWNRLFHVQHLLVNLLIITVVKNHYNVHLSVLKLSSCFGKTIHHPHLHSQQSFVSTRTLCTEIKWKYYNSYLNWKHIYKNVNSWFSNSINDSISAYAFNPRSSADLLHRYLSNITSSLLLHIRYLRILRLRSKDCLSVPHFCTRSRGK